MAGSFRHMTTPGKQLLNNENFHDMLENGGDVYEAAEECFGMIWWLADQLVTAFPGTTRETWIDMAVTNHQDGLELGGQQEED